MPMIDSRTEEKTVGRIREAENKILLIFLFFLGETKMQKSICNGLSYKASEARLRWFGHVLRK